MSWKKGAVLCVLIGAVAVQRNWDTISERLGLDEMSPSHVRAIEVAKSAFTLDRSRTNHAMIEARIAESGGRAQAGEWTALRQSDRLFLVTLSFTEDGEPDDYYFQVDVGNSDVINVRDDAELEALYSVPPARPR